MHYTLLQSHDMFRGSRLVSLVFWGLPDFSAVLRYTYTSDLYAVIFDTRFALFLFFPKSLNSACGERVKHTSIALAQSVTLRCYDPRFSERVRTY